MSEFFSKESKLWIVFDLFGKFCTKQGYELNIDLYEAILSYLSKVYNPLISDFDPNPFKQDYGVEYYDVSHRMWREALREGDENCQTIFFVNHLNSYEKVVKVLLGYSLKKKVDMERKL